MDVKLLGVVVHAHQSVIIGTGGGINVHITIADNDHKPVARITCDATAARMIAYGLTEASKLVK